MLHSRRLLHLLLLLLLLLILLLCRLPWSCILCSKC
jgi:hypothetical protein